MFTTTAHIHSRERTITVAYDLINALRNRIIETREELDRILEADQPRDRVRQFENYFDFAIGGKPPSIKFNEYSHEAAISIPFTCRGGRNDKQTDHMFYVALSDMDHGPVNVTQVKLIEVAPEEISRGVVFDIHREAMTGRNYGQLALFIDDCPAGQDLQDRILLALNVLMDKNVSTRSSVEFLSILKTSLNVVANF